MYNYRYSWKRQTLSLSMQAQKMALKCTLSAFNECQLHPGESKCCLSFEFKDKNGNIQTWISEWLRYCEGNIRQGEQKVYFLGSFHGLKVQCAGLSGTFVEGFRLQTTENILKGSILNINQNKTKNWVHSLIEIFKCTVESSECFCLFVFKCSWFLKCTFTLPSVPRCCWSGPFWTQSSSWVHRLGCESPAQRDAWMPTRRPPPSPAGIPPPASGRPTTAPVCPHRAARAPRRRRREAMSRETRRVHPGWKDEGQPSTCTEK